MDGGMRSVVSNGPTSLPPAPRMMKFACADGIGGERHAVDVLRAGTDCERSPARPLGGDFARVETAVLWQWAGWAFRLDVFDIADLSGMVSRTGRVLPEEARNRWAVLR